MTGFIAYVSHQKEYSVLSTTTVEELTWHLGPLNPALQLHVHPEEVSPDALAVLAATQLSVVVHAVAKESCTTAPGTAKLMSTPS